MSEVDETRNAPVQQVHDFLVDAMSVPTFVKLSTNLFAACFDCMKAIPADFILKQAIARRELSPGGRIVETSSGTFARGLAWAARKHGLRCTIVTSNRIDDWLKSCLQEFAVDLQIVPDPGQGLKGNQQARMERLDAIRQSNPKIYWPCQYQNPDNATAYSLLAQYIRASLGDIDYLVGAVGTGGSTGGTATALRQAGNDVCLVGVDLPGSVLFGQQIMDPRLIGGMSSSLMPPCIQHDVYDIVSWVPEGIAAFYVRKLHRTHMLYHGASSGTVFAVASWLSRIYPDKRFVAVFPDGGIRYHKTFYDVDWLRQHNLLLDEAPESPVKEVQHPDDLLGQWTWLNWKRRAFKKVLGRDPDPQVFQQ